MEKEKAKKNKWIFYCIIGMLLFAGAKSAINEDSHNTNSKEHQTACKTAELAVQSKKVEHSCPTESKVIYENEQYIIVAVKYWLTDETKDTYWITFVRCYGNGEYWNSMIDGNGIDYDDIPEDIINELKIKWELK